MLRFSQQPGEFVETSKVSRAKVVDHGRRGPCIHSFRLGESDLKTNWRKRHKHAHHKVGTGKPIISRVPITPLIRGYNPN